jgi:hypothetical protein
MRVLRAGQLASPAVKVATQTRTTEAMVEEYLCQVVPASAIHTVIGAEKLTFEEGTQMAALAAT